MSANGEQYQARLKEALVALQKMRSKLEALEHSRSEPVAVIGLGFRFPGGVNDPASFWRLLQNGVDAIGEVPADRWGIEAYYDPDPDTPGKISSRWGGFLTGVDQFDAHFFGISPREASSMDPQQRLLLEVSWEVLEHAGQSPTDLAGSQTGVFIGITVNDYLQLQTRLNQPTDIDAYRITGNSLNSAAGRLSYTLGLHGPAMIVDTACSSSLVAVHLACQSLHSGESELALAGGVNLILSPDMSISASKAKMLAADGRCKTFDARADGFVRSEGCGVVVLKRLSDALAHGDNILALIRGTAVNQDGFSSGLTVPNKLAQEAVIRAALANAGLKPAQISYVEAHGTGTSLGDPIEVRALAAVLGQDRPLDSPFYLGSVKTNLGHLESAAGIAGLIKVVLALHHQEIPPHLHFQTPTPNIAWAEIPVIVPTQAVPWPAQGERFAGVSSFGASGTNAHAILSTAPLAQSEAVAPERPYHLLALSAKQTGALRQLAGRFEQLLAQPPASLADICFTANTGRAHFEQRLAVVANSVEQMHNRLAVLGQGETPAGAIMGQLEPDDRPKLAFLFTGHGSQYLNMGRVLAETAPVFRQALEQCAELLRPYLEQPLLSMMYPEGEASPVWQGMKYTQPMLFTLEYALARLWRSWGVEPDVVLGHSVGEYVAACIAEVMKLEDGLKLVATRGRLMEELPHSGVMAAVFADEARVAKTIAPYQGQVAIAVMNGPANMVISGAGEAVETILAGLQAEGVKSRRLAVAQASHSPLVEPILAEFEQIARQVQFQAPRLPLVSNVTGQLFKPSEVPDAAYWRRHLRETVKFGMAMEMLQARGYQIFLEIGPNPTLLGMGRRCLPEEAGEVWLPSLREGRNDWQQMLESLGSLYGHGLKVDWAGFDQSYPRRRVALPSYPFQRKRYWLKASGQSAPAAATANLHPLLGYQLRSAGKEIIFETQLSLDSHPFLADHRVHGVAVFPATAYLEMAQAAAQVVFGATTQVVEEMTLQKPLVLGDEARLAQLILTPGEAQCASFQIFSLEAGQSASPAGRWTLHVAGTVRPAQAEEKMAIPPSLAELQAHCQETLSVDQHYRRLSHLGLEFGEGFRGVEQIWRHSERGEILGQIALPETLVAEAGAYQLHPALLDAGLQLLGSSLPNNGARGEAYLPLSIEEFRLHGRPARRLWSYVTLKSPTGSSPDTMVGDVLIFDESRQFVAKVKGFTLRRAEREAVLPAKLDDSEAWLYEVNWQSKPVEQTELCPPGGGEQGRWLIFADETGVGRRLAERFRAVGLEAVLVYPGEIFEATGPTGFKVNPTRFDDFRQLILAVTAGDQPPCRGIIHLWSLDEATGGEGLTTKSLIEAQIKGCGSALYLTQALIKESAEPANLWLVTRGAQPVWVGDEANLPPEVAQAPLWGLGKVITQEHPELNCACLDLDPAGPADEIEILLRVLEARDGESQVALRRQERFTPRLVRRPTPGAARLQPLPGQPFQIDISARGVLDHLEFRPLTRRPPAPREVEVEVYAVGLGFRDVLNALGMYPGDPGSFGSECAGRVVAVGADVTELQVGDEVMGVAPGSFSSFVTVQSDFMVRKPDHLSLAEAATLPSAFLTAYYTLHRLAGIAAGDRILIHAAAGGVGLAAVQLARRAGAEIFGTAGSPEKRAFLKSYGIQHVLDSRSLDFAEEIMTLTQGQGVDIVLNSLNGEFIPKSLSLLTEQGRFLEIGKRDIWTPEQVAALKPNAAYFVIDLMAQVQQEPGLIAAMLAELSDILNEGSLRPLPLRLFPIQQVTNAFHFMARAKHIGKIAVTSVPEAVPDRPLPIRAEATYLITGGLGGLGLVVARWLLEQGARHLVLCGRSSPTEEAYAVLHELEQAGAQVVVAQADVAQDEQMGQLFDQIEQSLPPLRGVIHAAGVLDDGILLQQDWSRFARVFAPKVAGGWNLHLLTRDKPLDFFVLFSSAVSLLGSAGQANHVAASTFLDSLAYHRRAQGLPALSLDWGPWLDVGAAAKRKISQQMNQQGVTSLTPAQGIRVFEQILHQLHGAVSPNPPQLGVISIDWSLYLREKHKGADAFYQELSRNLSTPASQPLLKTEAVEERSEVSQRLAEAPLGERRTILQSHVRAQVLKVLGLEPAYPLGRRQKLQELGLDSLMAVELRSQLGVSLDLKRKLPATLLFDYPTVEALTGFLVQELSLADAEPDERRSAAQDAALRHLPPSLDYSRQDTAMEQALTELEQLSDEEAEALLLAELGKPQGGI